MTNHAFDPAVVKYGLRGRVVTMDDDFTEIADGVVYVDGKLIAEVAPAAAPAPHGFEAAPVVATGGTLLPGLIELHNHLAYNALQLWAVDKQYENRDRWAGTPSYRAQVTGPMKVLGSSPEALPALIRYVECKCLLAGVTTSQGVALFSNQGVRRFYKGLVRNVEQPADAGLPAAAARIADVAKGDAQAFLAHLKKETCLLLHLSEGTDDAAHDHFRALEIGQDWAITPSLSGIHCVALTRADFDVMASRGASMVWSPLSNLLLYGKTAAIADARAAGLRIGLGADWSYSGSKNLLAELQIARLHAQGSIPDREIAAMATANAAKILRWDEAIGTIERGKRADLVVLDGATGDAYDALFRATEAGVRLVTIDGVPRAGATPLMSALGATGEVVHVGGEERVVALNDPTADPTVAAITLAEAIATLSEVLHDLPGLAKRLETGTRALSFSPFSEGPPVWFLALDELAHVSPVVHPRSTGVDRAPAKPLSAILQPLELDPITVADDPTYRARLASQRNLPASLRSALQGAKAR